MVEKRKLYTQLDPRRELEQQVAKDLDAALRKRGATVKHHGTPASHAPATAPADVTVEWKSGKKKWQLLVEVTQRTNETEFAPIRDHLERAEETVGNGEVHLLYSGPTTPPRLIRMIREENKRRAAAGKRSRILFVRLNDLQELLLHWKGYPANLYPVRSLEALPEKWEQFQDDLPAIATMQRTLFPDWTEKAQQIDEDQQKRIAQKQERLRKDIVKLENKLRERGIAGQLAHKTLVILFFVALFEERRSEPSRVSREGFLEYKNKSVTNKDRNNPDYREHTLHHLIDTQIRHDDNVRRADMLRHYEKVKLTDDFVLSEVIPVFESYSFSESGMDFIGAVFEALARRSEKDNRIGQFFTPETAVVAACQMVDPGPEDTVLDPACGTSRFLIHAMDRMLRKKDTVPGKSPEDVERSIKQHQLLGTDIDPWVATIAKMNMYIHGDGKSNITADNGLALSAKTSFGGKENGALKEAVDVVLTNPPLGDINFYEVAKELARNGLIGETAGESGGSDYGRSVDQLAKNWLNKRLSVVPSVCKEERQLEDLKRRLQKLRADAAEALRDGQEKKHGRLEKQILDCEAKCETLQQTIGRGDLNYETSGRVAKGGALFLSAIRDYLKSVRDPKAPEEWKGGIVGIVIDEAVLNTRQYEKAREYLVKHFFVKAIVSLPRNAFEFLAKTTAKTSLIILVKKPDPDVLQREPIYFSKADTIGYTSTGIDNHNDLHRIVRSFKQWRGAMQAAYVGGVFNEKAANANLKSVGGLRKHFWTYKIDHERTGQRLDFAYQRMVDVVSKLKNTVRLGDLVEEVIRNPGPQDQYELATISRADGRVRFKTETALSYKPKDLRVIKTGDILLSGIDVVHGSVGAVQKDADGLIVSKEYFTLRPRKDAKWKVVAEYVACVLRSPAMKVIIEGTITGTSNRTRIQDINAFLDIPLPTPKALSEQQKVAKHLKELFRAQDAVTAKLEKIARSVATA